LHLETRETDFRSLKSVTNLVYYICDDYYKDVLSVNLKHLYKHNDVDTCCIAPRGFKPNKKHSPTHIYYVDNFDYKYTAKFIISEWNKISNYENILYLDTDAIPCKPLHDVFNTIQEQNNVMHGVLEKLSLNKSDLYHKFSHDIYPDNTHAYNAGTFGFNIKLLPILNEYIQYTNEVRGKAILDQPIFNEFFNKKKIIYPTLSKFTYLFNDIYKDINNTPLSLASIVHFLGNAYAGKHADIIDSILTYENA
jgi:lipopolysaccharide biosynthesis glycosyltransferase